MARKEHRQLHSACPLIVEEQQVAVAAVVCKVSASMIETVACSGLDPQTWSCS